jgi:hypothetical protein
MLLLRLEAVANSGIRAFSRPYTIRGKIFLFGLAKIFIFVYRF